MLQLLHDLQLIEFFNNCSQKKSLQKKDFLNISFLSHPSKPDLPSFFLGQQNEGVKGSSDMFDPESLELFLSFTALKVFQYFNKNGYVK